MWRFIGLILCLLCLGGCNPVTVDISYSRTDKGYINSGLFSQGELFLWDLETNKIADIASIDLSRATIQQPERGDRTAANKLTDVEIGVGGGTESWKIDAIKSAIKTQASVELEKFETQRLVRPIEGLHQYLNFQMSNDNTKLQIENDWQLKESSRLGSKLRYIFIHYILRADKASFGWNSTVSASNSFKIPTINGSVDVSIKGASTDQWNGKAVAVIFDAKILKLTMRNSPDGNTLYFFQDDLSVPDAQIVAAFRRQPASSEAQN